VQVPERTVSPERAGSDVRPGAYRVLSLVAATHAVNHAYAALLPILYPTMMADLRFGYSQLGLLLGISRGLGQGLQWLPGYVGQFVQRKVLLGIGTVAQGVFLGLSGLSQGFVDLLGWQSLTKLAGSPQHPNGNALLLDYFGRTHRGRALSLHFAGGNLGTVLVPLAGALLLGALGWRITLACFALPGIAVGLFVLWAITEGREAKAVVEDRPSFGRETLAILRNRNLRFIIGAQTTAAGGRGLGVVITFVPLYLSQELGLSVVNTGLLYTLMLIGSVVGPTLAGFVSDRLGARKPVLITLYLASTLTTVLLVHLGTTGAWLLPLVLFVLGCVVYAESPMLQSLTADSTEGFSQDMVFGLYHSMGFGAGALWAVAMGVLVESLGFRTAFHVMAASYTAAALWILPLHPPSGPVAADRTPLAPTVDVIP
jgi:sugar phosphate permease